MGQGYSLATLSAGSASIDIPELADLVYEKSLGTARFMKSVRARNQDGLVSVKAFVKPYPSFGLRKYLDILIQERDALANIPNTLGYQRILETANGGFLARQYAHSSVYDRMSTRPFLEDIEKKWMAFQLLSAIRDCHARDIFHGDIKTENLLVTSWNWLYLTDFSSSFKPTYLPEDNPADFSFYFDTSGRRTCYLAPERFTSPGESPKAGGINWAMDIFSAGCVIAEIFLEGPIFTLSQLFRYRKGDVDLDHTQLGKLEDNDVREFILHMIRLEPESRYPAEEILTFWRGKVFPEYFYGFLHQYMALLTDSSSGRKAISLENNAVECDERIERVYLDFDKISYFLGYTKQLDGREGHLPLPFDFRELSSYGSAMRECHAINNIQGKPDEGTLIFLGVVLSSLRSTSKAAARIKACDLLLVFGQRLPDEIKLDRILPYLVILLSDPCDMVQVVALRSMAQLLATICVVSPVNAYIFPEYIFPRLKLFMLSRFHQPSPMIRASYASCLSSLAQTSTRILELMQAIKADGRLPDFAEDDWASEATFHGLFDVARVDLVSHFEEATKALITDPDSSVRRAFLNSVPGLCVFFGSTKTSDVILTHLNTYLNDPDWILKCSFFETLVAVAALVGVVSLEKFLLPLMIQSLTDPEAFVVERVMRSLTGMAELGLFRKTTLLEVLAIVIRFLIHPSVWIREASASFVASCSKQLSVADRYCILLPLLQPLLRIPVLEFSETQILDSLKKPLPRPVLEMAVVWATKTEKGLFWKSAVRDAVFVSPEADASHRSSSAGRKHPSRISSSQRNEEDEQWLTKLRGLGLQPEDEVKLLILREFIWRVAQRKPGTETDGSSKMNTIVSLNEINVTPQNIFFDNTDPVRPAKGSNEPLRNPMAGIQGAVNIPTVTAPDHSVPNVSSPNVKKSSGSEPTGHGMLDSSKAQRILASNDGLDPSYRSSPPSSTTARAAPRNSAAESADQRRTRPADTRARTEGEGGGSRGHHARHILSTGKSPDSTLSHRSSAINLLNRKETSKADAAIAFTSENAFGKLDGPLQPWRATEPSPLSLAVAASRSRSLSPRSQTADLRYESNHSYAGNDRNILRLLDNHFRENFPTDLLDLGQVTEAIDPKTPIPRLSDSSQPTNTPGSPANVIRRTEPWQPSGHLLTRFNEHTAAVNCVVPSPDHAFFATASDDGTCRIWDTTRLERNLTPRSRRTYKHPTGAKFKALCFVENSHAFVTAADDGSVHVVNIDYKKVDSGESTRYGKMNLAKIFHISRIPKVDDEQQTPEHGIYVHHHRTQSSQSVILLLTCRSRVMAVDAKTMASLYTLENPFAHGSPTSFVVDKRNNWILIGTSHGILDLWDLRFRLLVRSWGLKSGRRIQRICHHPSRGKGKWVIIAAGTEISVWDIEKPSCKEVYLSGPRPTTQANPPEAGPTRSATITSTAPYEPWFPNDEGTTSLLGRFTKSVDIDGTITDPAQLSLPSGHHSEDSSDTINPQWTFTSLSAGYDIIHHPSSPNDPVKAPFLISGGSDRKLRFWDLVRPEYSSVISGTGASPEDGFLTPEPRYEVTHPGGQITLVSELSPSPSTKATATSGTPTKARRRDGSKPARGSGGSAGHGTSAASSASSNKPPRSSIIAKQQQMLLRNHLDDITDCCLLARPYGVVVSVDRGGGVFVFQ